jgi:2'-5' RNA ligase
MATFRSSQSIMPRRNVRKLHFRPPLPRRAVVWFPPFPGDSGVENFRREYDPVAGDVPAHLTFVFPFSTTLTSVQVASHVKRIVCKWPPLPVGFRDVEGLLDTFVLLMVRERDEAVTHLHDKLYEGVMAPHLKRELTYTPHVTLGRCKEAIDFAPMYDAANAKFGRGREWHCVLRELAVLQYHEDGTISIDQKISLNTQ